MKRRRPIVVAWGVLRDLRARVQARTARSTRLSGSAEKRLWSVAESVDYIDAVFGLYLERSGFGKEELHGRHVLEIGPGDNLGVALRFVAAGAQVTCVDRFHVWRDTERENAIYAALYERLDEAERARLPELSGTTPADTLAAEGRLAVRHGVPLETAPAELGRERFDLIVSGAVLEHLYDPDAAFDAMDAMLRPGGRMVHAIDMRDHGMFGPDGMRLEFLTVPAWLYRRMTRHSGGPNRRLAPYYRGQMERRGYDYSLLIVGVAGEERPIDPPKPRIERGTDYGEGALAALREVEGRLAREFRGLGPEDLLPAQIVLSATKP